MFALLCALSDDSDRIGSAEIYESDGLDFKFVGAEIVQKPSCDMPALGGDKTLKLTFADAEKNVEQILYYTPYSRGGVARRTEIINNGTKPIKLKGIGQQFALPAGLEKLTECGIGGVVGERRGAAYGFCAMYGGECVFDVAQSAGDTHVYVGIDLGGAYKLGSGMTLRSPEILAVYSEAGTDGVSRVFHDILRERTVKNRRRALAVEYPTADQVNGASCSTWFGAAGSRWVVRISYRAPRVRLPYGRGPSAYAAGFSIAARVLQNLCTRRTAGARRRR